MWWRHCGDQSPLVVPCGGSYYQFGDGFRFLHFVRERGRERERERGREGEALKGLSRTSPGRGRNGTGTLMVLAVARSCNYFPSEKKVLFLLAQRLHLEWCLGSCDPGPSVWSRDPSLPSVHLLCLCVFVFIHYSMFELMEQVVCDFSKSSSSSFLYYI